MRNAFALLVLPALVAPAGAQTLADRLKDAHKAWDGALERGDSASVRRTTEGLLQREALGIGTSDYNEMRALVALEDYAARACAEDGAWEDAVGHLQRAASSASDNFAATEGTFSRIRKEHETKLLEWRETIAKQEQRLKDLESQPGLTEEHMKLRSQIRSFLDEHRSAVAHSEWSLKEIDGLLVQLRKEKETYATSLAAWQDFLAREKQEIVQAGDSSRYVVEKLQQVKADDARPRVDRLAYGRRLLRLDPNNADCKQFVSGLLGIAEDTEPQAPAKKKAAKPKKG
jgi:hypothetical protein